LRSKLCLYHLFHVWHYRNAKRSNLTSPKHHLKHRWSRTLKYQIQRTRHSDQLFADGPYIREYSLDVWARKRNRGWVLRGRSEETHRRRSVLEADNTSNSSEDIKSTL
jgi:hypothetical protein